MFRGRRLYASYNPTETVSSSSSSSGASIPHPALPSAYAASSCFPSVDAQCSNSDALTVRPLS